MSETGYYEQVEIWGEAKGTEREEQRIRGTVAMLPDSSVIVDAGAGDGRLTAAIRAAFPEALVVAADRSSAAIAHAAPPSLRCDVANIPLRDGAADGVVCCEVLEHLPDPVFEAVRRELARVAHEWILVTVPNAEDLRRGRVTCRACGCRFHRNRHVRAFAPHDLVALVPGFHLRQLATVGAPEKQAPWRLGAAVKRLGLSRGGPISTAMCPQCGLTDGAAPSSKDQGSTSSNTKRAIAERVVPLPRRSPWLAALLERS